MSHKTPVKKDKSSQRGSGKGLSGRHKATSAKGKKDRTSQTLGALSETSDNVRKAPKTGDSSLKKEPDSPSTQRKSFVVATPAPKTSRKPKNPPGYLTFKLSAPVNRDILNGVRLSTLLTSHMPSPQAGEGSSGSTNPSGDNISGFLRVVAAGYWTHFYVSVSIGEEDPYTTYLLADSGSAITILNENAVMDHIREYPETDLLKYSEDITVNLRFTSTGSIIGKVYKNTVTLDDAVTAEDQQFAVAIDPELPKGGILGIGPTSQTKGKVEGQPNKEILTVLDNLVKNKTLKVTVLGMNLFPWDETEGVQQRLNAEYHFGGMDKSAIIKSTLRTVPITQYFPSSEAYGVDVEVTCGGSNGKRVCILGMKDHLATGIIDTGEHGILLPEKAVEEYMEAIDAEATPPPHGSGFSYWSIPRKNLLKLEPLALHFRDINGRKVTFKLPVDAQLFPPVVTDELGLPNDRLYLTVKARPQARPGFGVVLGVPVLMRLYFAIDLSNGQRVVKISKTRYTDMESPGLAKIRRELIKEEERRKAAQKGKRTEGEGRSGSSKKASGLFKGKERRK